MKTNVFFPIVIGFFAAIFLGGCTEEKGAEITGLALDKQNVELRADETAQLIAIITPQEAAQGATVSWASKDAEIATVSNDGLVTAVSIGETEITATLGQFTAVCTVSVVDIAVESVQLNKITLSMVKGEKETLQATVLPEDADNVAVTWSSSDEAVATVSEEGEVEAIYPGNAVITATAGGVSATCDMEVIPAEVESVTLDKTEASIFCDETIQLTATIHPDGTGAVVKWSTSDYNKAEVSEDGTVLGKLPGEVTITATAEGKSATCNITILPVEARSITLDPTEMTLSQGESASISATVDPENYDGNIEWTSDNTDVAVVDRSGYVTAVKDGHATITATLGEATATCSVTVSTAASDLNVGDFYYSDGTWSSELDPSKTAIGVVFWVGDPTATDPTLAEEHPECTHGYVVALQEGSEGAPFMEDYDGYVDATNGADFVSWIQVNAPQYQSILQNGENLSTAQGYNNTKALEFFNENYPAYPTIAQFAVSYRETCPAPDNTSDWYVPSPKEGSLLVVGEWDGDLMAIELMNRTNYRDMINSKIAQISGATQLNTGTNYWTSGTSSTPTANVISMSLGWVTLSYLGTSLPVRCILAF